MFRKFNLKTLSITFAVLMLASILTYVADSAKGVSTLKNVLFEVNTDDVTEIIIKPKMLNGDNIVLKKEGTDWKVESKGNSYNGDASMIEGIITQINKLKPLRLAAKNKDKWQKFELTDSLSSKVQLKGKDGLLAELFIGKFSYRQAQQNPAMMQNPYYQQPRGTMTTYVRSDDDDEVYAVEGFLASSINRDASAFRNKQLLKTTAGELSKITFNYPADSSFTIIKNEDKWMCDGLALDSAKVAQYLSGLRTINASGFTDKIPGSFTHTITLQDNQMQNIEVKAELQGEDAVFTSSQNKGTIFKEDKTRNFDKIFIPKSKLLP